MNINLKTKIQISLLLFIRKFRSPIVWASLGSLILWILKTSGKLDVLGLDAESFNNGWNLLTGVMIAVGILSNTDRV
jgi:hypothetical protein